MHKVMEYFKLNLTLFPAPVFSPWSFLIREPCASLCLTVPHCSWLFPMTILIGGGGNMVHVQPKQLSDKLWPNFEQIVTKLHNQNNSVTNCDQIAQPKQQYDKLWQKISTKTTNCDKIGGAIAALLLNLTATGGEILPTVCAPASSVSTFLLEKWNWK